MKTAFYNLSFRGLAVLGRFLILIGIGKYLTVEDLGIYGLFYTSVIISIYIIGFDFYTYNTRELIAAKNDNRLHLILDQLIFHAAFYVILLPALLSIFIMDIVPIKYIYMFYLVLIFEHISQEIYRVFTALKKTVYANFISFIKTGLWVYVLFFLWYLDFNQLKNLDTVFILWFSGAFLSVLISIGYLAKLKLGKFKDYKINRDWILQGIKISIPFFISSLAYKIVEFSNRYFIDFFRDKSEVGIFTFYNGIANLINVIVFTAVIMIYYPKLYDYYINNKTDLYKKTINQFSILVISISLSIAVILVFGIPVLLNIINKSEIYNQHLNVYYILIAANVILNISLIPHYIMYVKKKDNLIMKITIVGAIVNLIFNYIFIQTWGLTGVAYSSLISFFLIFVLKYYYRRDNEIAGI